jgi:hypothetical protein
MLDCSRGAILLRFGNAYIKRAINKSRLVVLHLTEKSVQKGKANLPIVRCKCGAEFLLIPDLNEMSRIVEKHAQMHREKESDHTKAELVFAQIQNHLITEIFQRIRQIS